LKPNSFPGFASPRIEEGGLGYYASGAKTHVIAKPLAREHGYMDSCITIIGSVPERALVMGESRNCSSGGEPGSIFSFLGQTRGQRDGMGNQDSVGAVHGGPEVGPGYGVLMIFFQHSFT
jgi:hypothetical protein